MEYGRMGIVSTRLTPREGRKFAFTVGAAFLVLSSLFWYKGKSLPSEIMCGIGFLLVLLGLTVPARLGPVQRAWMSLAAILSRITNPIFMGIIYFGVFTPLNLIMCFFRRNILVHLSGKHGYWIPAAQDRDIISRMERQF